jgi:hypothetical protein
MFSEDMKKLEETKYMFIPCHQNAGQNHDRQLINPLNIGKVRYLRMTPMNENCFYEEMRAG